MTDIELKTLKDNLWHSADMLRAGAHLAANKYGQPILGLIFLRYADILFKQHKQEIDAEYQQYKGTRMEREYKDIAIEKCGFFLPECAYYDTINNAPDDAHKAVLVKKAMETIEEENPKMEGAPYDRILEKDEWKDRFKVLGNLLMNLYDASKPEIFERGWQNDKFKPLVYLYGLFCNQVDDEKLDRAKARMAKKLDQSVSSSDRVCDDADWVIHQGKVIDLSKIDIDSVRKEISTTPYKALEIEDLRIFIEKVLQQLIDKNCTRVLFSQRYKSIIDRYNAGGSENEDYYERLLQLIEELKKEQSRSTDMGLEEEELEIYDLLIQGKKLTKAEEQKVKLAAKNLYQKLMAEKENVMVVDWYKDEQPRKKVLSLIQVSLNEDLPESYDRISFTDKTNLLLNHFIDMAVQGYGWAAA